MRKAINIQVGDRTYPFRMTLGAMLRFKRATGKDLAREALDAGPIAEGAQLLYACLASAPTLRAAVLSRAPPSTG